jgi:hypothetical protein
MTDPQTPHSDPTPTGNPKADAKAAKAYAKASRKWYQKKRWWAAGALALIIIGGGMSDSGETTDEQQPVASDANTQSEPSEQPAEETAAEPAAEEEEKAEDPAPAPEAKAMKVEAAKIVKEFEENELAADAKYQGKDLLITGRIDKIDTDMWDDEKYVLRLGGKWDILSVSCYDMANEELASLKTGQTVTVRGTFDDGGDLGVEVTDCSLA